MTVAAQNPGPAEPSRLGGRQLSRRFGAVLANDDISFEVRRASVHAFVGANGAGKSTLMRLLQGMDRPDGGQVLCNGMPIALSNPAHAFSLGIGMVHQEFMLVPGLTLLENLILGAEPSRAGVIDWAAALRAARGVEAQAGVSLDWSLKVEDVPIHQLQILEILRLLYRGADLLILDEPTALLAPAQVQCLLTLLRSLRDAGHTILFISHKLDEVLALADDITVLRAGRVVAQMPVAQADRDRLTQQMIGHLPTPLPQSRQEAAARTPTLELRALDVQDRRGIQRLHALDLHVAQGQILGIAGISGNGQDELIAAVAGLSTPQRGSIWLAGQEVTALGIAERRQRGLAYLSPDRAAEGLCLPATIRDNVVAGHHRLGRFMRHGLLRRQPMAAHAQALLDDYAVLRADDGRPVRSLSGGNQQRVVMARELDGEPQLLIAAQPTRGIDVQGIRAIHERLLAFRARGGAVLLVSDELEELLALADEIAVLRCGRIVACLPRADANAEVLGRLMLGGTT